MFGTEVDIEAIFSRWEKENSQALKDAVSILKPVHAVMPLTYVGSRYGAQELNGIRLPKLLILSINQSRRDQPITDDAVRKSLGTIEKNEKCLYKPDGFGPRALAANLSRWIFMACGVPSSNLTPEAVHEMIAYDNFVKWTFDKPNSTPPKEAWQFFYSINRAVIEAIKPDILLCLGHRLYDNEVWNALTQVDHARYDWKSNVENWAYSILPPWGGQIEIGWCYHYSNPIWPNRAWRDIRKKQPPQKDLGLFGEPVNASPDTLEKEIQKVQDDTERHPWWGTDVYDGSAFTRYNPYCRFVADRVCQKLVSRWKEHSDGKG